MNLNHHGGMRRNDWDEYGAYRLLESPDLSNHLLWHMKVAWEGEQLVGLVKDMNMEMWRRQYQGLKGGSLPNALPF